MVFAAQKLRMHPHLKNPNVIIVVDRIDLDSQITTPIDLAGRKGRAIRGRSRSRRAISIVLH